MQDSELQQAAVAVKSANGTLDDLVGRFTDANIGSLEFKKTKDKIQQRLSFLRSEMRKRCEAQNIPVERIKQVIPNFRTGRKSSKSEVLDDLFSQIMEE